MGVAAGIRRGPNCLAGVVPAKDWWVWQHVRWSLLQVSNSRGKPDIQGIRMVQSNINTVQIADLDANYAAW